ncbi:unnamed protein product [Nyctereutes procyonoides]|uniref:(raccoon dog) hypothetical protein n=1 Tax=Nyctereutes procyonoides TaxID=34880 RepID=A0A811ZMG6_NYCPR|nr:unnamed protein product [Nyctereutes procyonoides]
MESVSETGSRRSQLRPIQLRILFKPTRCNPKYNNNYMRLGTITLMPTTMKTTTSLMISYYTHLSCLFRLLLAVTISHTSLVFDDLTVLKSSSQESFLSL